MEQKPQLATPSYSVRKEKEHSKKSSTASLSTATLTPVDPVDLQAPREGGGGGGGGGGRVIEETLASKRKTLPEDSPKASKPTSDDLKTLDDKGLQRFACLEAMILAKTFAVLVEPVQKTGSEVVTSWKPFFDPAASTSQKITSLVTQSSVVTTIGTSPVQATGEAASLTATQPVEAPCAKMRIATQPVEAPSMKVVTQPVEAPGARPVIHSQSNGVSSEEVQATRPVELPLTGKETVPAFAAGVSAHSQMDSDKDQCSEPGSPTGVTEEQGELSDRDIHREEELDQESSEEANYQETMRGVRSFILSPTIAYLPYRTVIWKLTHSRTNELNSLTHE